MNPMQDKILGALSRLALSAGCETTVQKWFANTGRLYVTRAGGFTDILVVFFGFYDDRCLLKFTGPGIDALNLSDNPPAYRFDRGELSYHSLPYHDGQRVEAMLALVERAMTGGTGPAYPLGVRHHADNPDNPYNNRQVIGEVERVPAGNSILRIGTVEPGQPGWVSGLAHIVLTPAERDRLISDLIAHRDGGAA